MTESKLRRAHGGFVLLSIFLLVLFALGIFAFTRLNSSSVRESEQDAETRADFAKIRDALVNFANTNGYLPCPADGTLGDGKAVPAIAAPSCTNANGVVPWDTLGLRSADTIDPFQNKISYRVYSDASGPAKGLTQAGGASMVNCDSTRTSTTTPAAGVDANNLCRATDHDTSPAQFLANKGFTVTDAGTSVPQVAFVLVSHGKNGAGAYTSVGVRNTLPNAASAEYNNTQTSGPFIGKAANTVGLNPANVNYFDDEISYLTISDMAGRAKTAARIWPVNSTKLTAAMVAAAVAAAGKVQVGASTNATTLSINGATYTSSTTGGGTREISAFAGTSGYGIGVITTAGTSTAQGYISGSDQLTINFGTTGQRLGIMLVDFGSVLSQNERAQITFMNGGSTVATKVLTSCRAGSQLASYSINDVPAVFDRIEISALNRVGSGSSSNLLVGEIALCAPSAVTCNVSSASTTTNCPYP